MRVSAIAPFKGEIAAFPDFSGSYLHWAYLMVSITSSGLRWSIELKMINANEFTSSTTRRSNHETLCDRLYHVDYGFPSTDPCKMPRPRPG